MASHWNGSLISRLTNVRSLDLILNVSYAECQSSQSPPCCFPRKCQLWFRRRAPLLAQTSFCHFPFAISRLPCQKGKQAQNVTQLLRQHQTCRPYVHHNTHLSNPKPVLKPHTSVQTSPLGFLDLKSLTKTQNTHFSWNPNLRPPPKKHDLKTLTLALNPTFKPLTLVWNTNKSLRKQFQNLTWNTNSLRTLILAPNPTLKLGPIQSWNPTLSSIQAEAYP